MNRRGFRSTPASLSVLRTLVLVLTVMASALSGYPFGVSPSSAAVGDPGTPDAAFNTLVGSSLGPTNIGTYYVYALAVQTDGKIVVGGYFRTNTSPAAASNYLARFNSDGSADTSFNANVTSLFDNSVEDLAIQPDGKIIVAGAFNTVGGAANRFLTRLNTDGTVDTGFRDAVGNALSHSLNSVAVRSSDGAIVVGGNFTSPSNYVAMFNADGSRNSSPASSFNTNIGVTIKGSALAVDVDSSGNVFAGGGTAILGPGTGAVAAVNADGTSTGGAATFNTAFANTITNTVRALVVDANGNVLVGGDFASPGRRIARFLANGSQDTAFNANSAAAGLGGSAQDLALQSDGKILVAGGFSTPVPNVARFNSSGTTDSSFVDTTANYTGYAITTAPQNKIVVGGGFSTPGNKLMRIYGSPVAGPLTFSSAAFPSVTVGSTVTLLVTVTNSGPGAATPTAITVTGANVAQAGGGSCSTQVAIAAGASCTVPLTWSPLTPGALAGAVLDIAYAGGANPGDALTLTGTASPSQGGGSGGGSSTNVEPVAATSTPTPSATPSTSPAPTTSPLGPVSIPNDPSVGAINGTVAEGGAIMLVGGQRESMSVTPDRAVNATGLNLGSTGFTMWIAGRGDINDPLGLTPKSALILQSEQIMTRAKKITPFAETKGTGFKPGSEVQLWMLPNTLVGTISVDASGKFAGKVDIPKLLSLGGNTLQANGYTTDGVVRSVSLGIDVIARQLGAKRSTAVTYFDANSARLTAAAKRSLDQFASAVPKTAKGVTVNVTGFVQPTSFVGNDKSLASARARAVSSYLRAKGLKGSYELIGKGRALQMGAAARRVVSVVAYWR